MDPSNKEQDSAPLVPDFEDITLQDLEPESPSGETDSPPPVEQNQALPQQPLPQQPEPEPEPEQPMPEGADPNVWAAYRFYVDQGILPQMDDFKGTPEEMQEVMMDNARRQQEEAVQYVYRNLPEHARPLMELAVTKGEELTLDDIRDLFTKVEDYVSTVPDKINEENAEQFLQRYYQEMEGDDEEIAGDKVAMYKDKGRLLEHAQNIHKKYAEEKQKQITQPVETARETLEQKQKRQQIFHDQMVESIDQTGWSDEVKAAVYEDYWEGRFKQRVEHAISNPRALAQAVEFFSHYDPNTGQFDLEAYRRQAFSPATREVANRVRNYWSGTNPGSRTPVEPEKAAQSGDFNMDNYEFVD